MWRNLSDTPRALTCDWFGGTYGKTSFEASALFRHVAEKLKLTAGRRNEIRLKTQFNMFAGVAELADAPDLGSGGNPVQVQVLSPAPRRSKVRFASTFLCKKVIRPLPCFSFFTKNHARLVCSVVNAFTTTRCRYQLFVSFNFDTL